jgi:23S rRNA (adenine2503-C2)-methyltransferase
VRRDLLGLDSAAFSAWLATEVGHSPRFHRAAYRHLLATGRWAPDEVPLWREADAASPGLIARLAALAAPEQAPAVAAHQPAEDPAYGTTDKLLLALADGRAVESVGIPMTRDSHRTVCVSSQVGCRQGCAFCRTARMGLVRDLSAHEIVGQLVAVNRAVGRPARNAVFMGMGEPLDNPEAVAQAARVLADRHGLSLAWDHITISTVGRIAALARWAEIGLERANLAVSLHAVDRDVRAALVPAARVEGLDELRAALARVPLPRGRRIMLAVVVIPGVTDRPDLVAALARWIGDLPVLVNLIPFNPFPGVPWRAPEAHETAAMREALDRLGVPVRLRATKGRDALAACGQLATGAVRAGASRPASTIPAP